MAPDELHIWYVFTDRVDETRLAAYRALCSEEELERCGRFLFDKDRRQCLVTRALVRTMLSHFADVDPRGWRFVENAHGRPEIASPASARLRFNLSHTHGLVACAVIRGGDDIGIDVEDLQRRTATLEIARRHFSPSEMEALEALSAERRKDAFFDYWTLKEAYIKARGLGMSIPLADFSLQMEDSRPPTIRFADSLKDDPRAWQFDLRRLTERYKLAVALRRSADSPVRIICQAVIPNGSPMGEDS